MALRRIEFESSRLIQAQILFLKSDDLKPARDAVNAAVERRHRQVRKLWTELLETIGITGRRRMTMLEKQGWGRMSNRKR